MKTTTLQTYVSALIVILMWSSAFVAVRIVIAEISPSHLALARYVVASLTLAMIWAFQRIAIPTARDLVRLAACGFFGFAIYNLALNTGQRTVSAGVASLLVNTVPVWTSILSSAFLRERISGIGWLGTFVAFAGVAMIAIQRGGWDNLDGDILFILAAAISQALYFVISKPLLDRYRPIEVTTYSIWLGTMFLLPFGGGLVETLRSIEPATAAAIVFLGVGPAAIAYLAWSNVLAALPAGRASNILFLIPVATIALGYLLLGEVLSRVSLIGGVIAILGVLLSRWELKAEAKIDADIRDPVTPAPKKPRGST